MIIGGILSGVSGLVSAGMGISNSLNSYKETERLKNETYDLISQTKAREEAARNTAEEKAKHAYEKEQKMMSMKEEALYNEKKAAAERRKPYATILTERMAEKASLRTSKQTLGSF